MWSGQMRSGERGRFYKNRTQSRLIIICDMQIKLLLLTTIRGRSTFSKWKRRGWQLTATTSETREGREKCISVTLQPGHSALKVLVLLYSCTYACKPCKCVLYSAYQPTCHMSTSLGKVCACAFPTN